MRVVPLYSDTRTAHAIKYSPWYSTHTPMSALGGKGGGRLCRYQPQIALRIVLNVALRCCGRGGMLTPLYTYIPTP